MGKLSMSYGPPGVQGVSTIMGIGASEPGEVPPDYDALLTKTGWCSIGVWTVGVVADKPLLRGIGLGAAAASFLVRQMAGRPK